MNPMKTKIFFLFIILITFFEINAQKTSFETWNRILKVSNVEWKTIYTTCPNFPKENINTKEFTQSVINWNNQYPNEVVAFYSLDEIKSKNPSPYYLGLPLKDAQHKYQNSFIQWVKESKISDRRMIEVAPSFPDMELTKESFDFEFQRWQQLYSHEYESLINAKELTALNPNYKGFIEVVQFPNFMGGIESKEKPVLEDNSNNEGKLAFELKLMNWVFVFDADNFKKTYGFNPLFPKTFNVERYRTGIVEKINETKRQRDLGNLETH